MTNLNSIPGIGKLSIELLEAAGFPSAESLAKAGVDELAAELERANTILRIAKKAPTRVNVEKWITSAQDLTGVETASVVTATMPVNYEDSSEVATMLANAPFAIPLPAKVLVEQKLAVADIPPAILLNRYSGDLEVRIEDRVPAPRHGRPAVPSSNVRIADTSATRIEFDTSKIKSTEELVGDGPRTITSKMPSGNDRVALIRAPRVETNLGRDPQSRRYIRGVLHSHPVAMTLGAAVTLLLAVLLPLAIISAGLLLLSGEMPERFGWVPKWLLAFPVALPVVGFCYLIWALPGTCRICGQKQFVPRACLKNTKAHHIRGLGHIVPVSLHILLFKWFRCTYCGTPVRLKK
ncbi:MAG: DUF4332 domain-containing protein [Luteolibacter sp.]|uniref:DUF4332 domain-containing protein n=1 Tax=Luteolibacter sp. TaxID=1962973 RepID=UPI003267CCD8